MTLKLLLVEQARWRDAPEPLPRGRRVRGRREDGEGGHRTEGAAEASARNETTSGRESRRLISNPVPELLTMTPAAGYRPTRVCTTPSTRTASTSRG